MSPDKMVRMANQIATFFKTQPNVDAPEKVGDHIRDFWEPRMRQQLAEHVAQGGDGLDSVVIRAVKLIA
ncbi:formate dehydrogenase subunit delta [Anianabacter salinae]|uniref:formate dehydrogenase subunit delta n=1 Tax=Anianabacter salinae TaxID=2851023 RepID=UPI00225DD412|nr:formate dehydrogenase subunit delta [Anianabacter salinae]MBV0914004.1 formate dehydrogenase subunit delta [Anianabacter salinae]